jgi:hypothetical protein
MVIKRPFRDLVTSLCWFHLYISILAGVPTKVFISLAATVRAWPSQKFVVSNGHKATIPRSGPVPGDAGVVPVLSLSSSMVEKDAMAFFDIFVVALFDPSIFATVKDFDVM